MWRPSYERQHQAMDGAATQVGTASRLPAPADRGRRWARPCVGSGRRVSPDMVPPDK